jgi:hypothetical protein
MSEKKPEPWMIGPFHVGSFMFGFGVCGLIQSLLRLLYAR